MPNHWHLLLLLRVDDLLSEVIRWVLVRGRIGLSLRPQPSLPPQHRRKELCQAGRRDNLRVDQDGRIGGRRKIRLVLSDPPYTRVCRDFRRPGTGVGADRMAQDFDPLVMTFEELDNLSTSSIKSGFLIGLLINKLS